MYSVHVFSQSATHKQDSIPSKEVLSFRVVESIPVYSGCENSPNKNHCFNIRIRKFIGRHFNTDSAKCLKYEKVYDKKLKKEVLVCKEEIKGERVVIRTSFVIDTLGYTTKIIAKSRYPSLSEEAIRVIKKLPRFKPGVQRGRKVRVRYRLPITFNIL